MDWHQIIYSEGFKFAFLETVFACGLNDPMGVYMNWHRKQPNYGWFEIISNAGNW